MIDIQDMLRVYIKNFIILKDVYNIFQYNSTIIKIFIILLLFFQKIIILKYDRSFVKKENGF